MKLLRAVLPPLIPFVAITATIEFLVRGGFIRSLLIARAVSGLPGDLGELGRTGCGAALKTSASAMLGFLR